MAKRKKVLLPVVEMVCYDRGNGEAKLYLSVFDEGCGVAITFEAPVTSVRSRKWARVVARRLRLTPVARRHRDLWRRSEFFEAAP